MGGPVLSADKFFIFFQGPHPDHYAFTVTWKDTLSVKVSTPS